MDPFKTSTKSLKTDLINVLQNALDEGRELVGEEETIDENGVLHKIPVMEAPNVGEWGAIRLPNITQLMDEIGIYQFDDKNLVTDSVIALALAADLAYQSEAVREPVVGGMYG